MHSAVLNLCIQQIHVFFSVRTLPRCILCSNINMHLPASIMVYQSLVTKWHQLAFASCVYKLNYAKVWNSCFHNVYVTKATEATHLCTQELGSSVLLWVSQKSLFLVTKSLLLATKSLPLLCDFLILTCSIMINPKFQVSSLQGHPSMSVSYM